MSDPSPLLEVRNLSKAFPVPRKLGQKRKYVHAVDDVSFKLHRGETLSIVGESGCGKSTLGRLLLRLIASKSGEVMFDGERIDRLSAGNIRAIRRRMQVVFQDPFTSLNPRLRVRDIIAEPIINFRLCANKAETEQTVGDLLERVGLPRKAMDRFPHEFSGGQRQRIGIARALASKPDLIVCDEAVSALDVSVKAQIVNLLQDLQKELGIALLFISHDLAIVEHITHRVAVMYLGKIVEIGERSDIFLRPKHPYTRALLSAVPVPDPMAERRQILLKGDIPSPIDLPKGCRFQSRCPKVFERCLADEPPLLARNGSQAFSCHLDG